MRKRLLAFFMMVSLVVGLLQVRVLADDEKQTVTINNVTKEFNSIYFVSPTGSDEIGDGSRNNPFATFYKAEQAAADGDCVFLLPGDHVLDVATYSDAYAKCYFSSRKSISIIGCNEKTVLFMDNRDITSRDTGVYNSISKATSYLSNFHIKFITRDSYTGTYNSILRFINGQINNVYFEKVGGTGLFYSHTAGVVDQPVVNNCIFNIGSAVQNDVSGSPVYTNTLFSATPSLGTNKNTVTRLVSMVDFDIDNGLPPDLLNQGTGTNPDGSQANIGVYGGPLAWGGTIYVNGEDVYSGDIPTASPILSVLLAVGEEVQLSVSNNLSDNANLTWTSNNPSVATVNGSGLVTAVYEGLTKVWAENADGTFMEYINIRVVGEEEIEELRLAVHLNVGESKKLYLNEDFNNITWISLDLSTVDVDDRGEITAVSPGLAIIQADFDGETYIIYVRVV